MIEKRSLLFMRRTKFCFRICADTGENSVPHETENVRLLKFFLETSAVMPERVHIPI